MAIRFEATLLLARRTATGIEVPAAVVEELGGGKRAKVVVGIGAHRYRSSIGSMGGKFMVPVSAEQRVAAGVAAGDRLAVTLALDTEPRAVELPPDLAEALAGEPEARRFFDGISYSQQRALVLSVEGARRAETRQRRVERTVELLRERRVR